MIVDAVPFVSVTGNGELCVPTNWSPLNVSDVGLTETEELFPVPDRVTVGEPLLVWMVAVSGLAPSAGVNLMYTVHEPVKAESGLEALQAFNV